MPLGILEDHKLEHVPGTAPLDELGHAAFDGDSHVLKHDPTGQIVLVPQPSDSPNDPYNWPRRKKELFTVAMVWSCATVGALAPLLGASFVPLSAEYKTSLQSFVGGVQGGLLLGNAFGSILFNSLAVKYGKRPFYLGTSLVLAATCFWAGASKSFASLVAARVIQGACMGPAEALFPASIAEIWFVHERGFRSALFTVATLSGISLAQPIAGAIIQSGSYRIAFYGMGGAYIFQLILMFFWMPETAFHREGAINIDSGVKDLATEVSNAKKATEHLEDTRGEKQDSNTTSEPQESISPQPKKTWAEDLRVYSGYYDPVSIWSTMFRPFRLLASVPVLWSTLVYTSAISWLVIISIVLSQVFYAPPYFFSVGAVGATSIPSFVASVMGTLISGPLVDGIARRMAKRNNGIFEPEFRVLITIAYLIFSGTGAFVWGHSLSKGDPWPVPVIVGLGLLNFGIQLAVTAAVTYVVDCHRESSTEAVAVMNCFKGIITFVFTETVNDWLARDGIRVVFFTLGGITIAVALTTIPMYIFGKRARSWARRRNVEGKAL